MPDFDEMRRNEPLADYDEKAEIERLRSGLEAAAINNVSLTKEIERLRGVLDKECARTDEYFTLMTKANHKLVRAEAVIEAARYVEDMRLTIGVHDGPIKLAKALAAYDKEPE